MKTSNKTLENKAQTFESRMIEAITSGNVLEMEKLQIEAEMLYKEDYLTESQFNFFTDLENLKEIF